MATVDVGFSRLTESELDRVRNWRNSPDVARFMYNDRAITALEHRQWFERVSRDPAVSYWLIELDGEPVGLANVVDLNFARKSASWAFYLADPRTRGRGVGQYVEYCVLDCVFDYWRLETLNCQVLASNPDVIALHKGVGFKEVGQIPERVVRDGQPIDAFALAMSRGDWLAANRERLQARIQAKGREPLPLLADLERESEEAGLSPRSSGSRTSASPA